MQILFLMFDTSRWFPSEVVLALLFEDILKSIYYIYQKKLLNKYGFLIFVELGFHDAKSDSLYDVPFNFFFLYSQHLSSLNITGLLDIFEKSRNGFDSNFSRNLLFLQVKLLPNCDLVESCDITGHSGLKKWIKLVSFQWLFI